MAPSVPTLSPKISNWRKTGSKTLGGLERGGGLEFEQAAPFGSVSPQSQGEVWWQGEMGWHNLCHIRDPQGREESWLHTPAILGFPKARKRHGYETVAKIFLNPAFSRVCKEGGDGETLYHKSPKQGRDMAS